MAAEPSSDEIIRAEAGFAHVATLAFVAARTVPGIGFPVSLVGGTAIAHATNRLGGRRGIAAGIAAAIESVAILGPARMSGPGGQLTTAPLVGWLAAHGRPRALQIAACAAVRAFFNAITTVLFIVIIAGGVSTYAGTYDATIGRIPGAPQGTDAALIATLAGIVVWSIGASWFQVRVFGRANRRWSEAGGIGTALAPPGPSSPPAPAAQLPRAAERRRFDPRAVIAAALIAFVLLLLSTSPPLLGAVALWLLVAWQLAPAESEVVKPGLILAGTVALAAFVVNWIGGDSVRDGFEHAARAALLVLTATWMRGAAGTDGVREVARRILSRLDRLRLATELRGALDSLSGDRRMGAAVRSLITEVRAAGDELIEIVDAAIDWVAAEAARFRPGAPERGPELAYGPLDLVILLGAMLPALTLAPG